MYKIILSVLLNYLFLGSLFAQNLVPNPGFEDYYPCDFDYPNDQSGKYYCGSRHCNGGMVYNGKFLESRSLTPKYWFSATSLRASFINDCIVQKIRMLNNGPISWYQPRGGRAFISIIAYGQRELNSNIEESRSYPSIKLSNPLDSGCYYEVSFYVKKINNERSYSHSGTGNRIACDRIGAYLSKDSLHAYEEDFSTFYNIVPQIENLSGNILSDSINYVKISGNYKAEGGEQYITIGNFRSNAETQIYPNIYGSAEYFIDDVSVVKIIPDFNLIDTIKICKDSLLVLESPQEMDKYIWSNGDTTQNTIISKSGNYWVNAQYGCFSLSDTVYVIVQDEFNEKFSLGNDTLLCSIAQGLTLKAPIGFDVYNWSTGESGNAVKVFEAGSYSVEAYYICGLERDTIKVEVFKNPEKIIDLDQDTSICYGSDLTLKVFNVGNYKSFLWNTGEISSSITIDRAGVYSLNAINKNNCLVHGEIRISLISPPEISVEKHQIVCENIKAIITANVTNADSVVWNDSKTESSLNVIESGIYKVEAFNKCFSTADSVLIETVDCRPFIPNLVTPNKDGKNDTFAIQTKFPRTFQVEIYDRWGIRVYENYSYTNSWPEDKQENGIYFYRIYDEVLNKYHEGWIEIIK
jgi:gliding motility-associated-like protein